MNKAALVMARLHFTAFVLSKNIDENKMPKFTLLFNYFAGLDFSPHLEGREGGVPNSSSQPKFGPNIPVTKSKIPLLMIICKIMRIIN